MTPHVQRWFDGRDWTEYTRPLPESALRPAVSAPVLPGGVGAAWLPGEPLPEPEREPTAGWPTSAGPADAATGWGLGGPASRFGTPAPAYGSGVPAPVTTGYGTTGYGTTRLGTPVDLGPHRSTLAPTGGWTTATVGLGAWQQAGAPAHWGWRVLATLLDGFLVAIPYVAAAVYAGVDADLGVDAAGQLVALPTTAGAGALGIGALLMLVLWFVNRVVVQGRTGQSWGKRIVGLRTVHEDTARSLGVWWALVRDVANVVNGVPLYLGYLWPLWDARRQAFSDKLTHALVLRDPR